MDYLVHYTIESELRGEEEQAEYVDRGTFEMVMFKNDPSCMFTDEDGTKVVFDKAGAYYA